MEKFRNDFDRAVEIKKIEMQLEEIKIGIHAMHAAEADSERIAWEADGMIQEAQNRVRELYEGYLKELSAQMEKASEENTGMR